MENVMTNPFKALCLLPLAALWVASASAQAQTAPAMAPSASMPMGQMHKGAAGSHDMKASMMMGMDGMQKMPMSGDIDKDFAMMMKMHHQQALNMARVATRAGQVAGNEGHGQADHRGPEERDRAVRQVALQAEVSIAVAMSARVPGPTRPV
jgi:hypothetical protein